MDKYEKVTRSIKQIMFNNFIGGIAWAVGATIGFSFIIALLTILSKQINFVPFIGNFAAQVTNYVLQNNPQLIK